MSNLTSTLRSNWSEKRTRTFTQVLGGMLLGVMLATCVQSAQATPPNPEHKVTLCHRTGSATNPYIVITTDIASDGYVKAGHNEHEQVGNGLGGDIIPAYEYVSKQGVVFDYPGKNLDTVIGGATGAEILANGCVIPTDESPSPTPTETVSPTPTETTPPPTTQPPRTHTPTWTPTWTPTNGATPGQHPLAMTGRDVTLPAIAAGLLALMGGGAFLLRRRFAE